MKNGKRIAVISSALLGAALLVFSCIEFAAGRVFPENAYCGMTLKGQTSFHLSNQLDFNGPLLVAFPVPKDWKASSTLKVTYSTSGLASAATPHDEIVDEVMVSAADVTEPDKYHVPYPEALENLYGTLDNEVEMEWIALQGTTSLPVASNDQVDVTINISMTVGETPVSFNTAVFVCAADKGFGNWSGTNYYNITETETVTTSKPTFAGLSAVSVDQTYSGELTEFGTKATILATSATTGKFLAAVAVPASWDLSEELTATYSSEGAADDVTDEAMSIVSANDPVSGKPYSTAIADACGDLDNSVDMQWIVVSGSTVFTLAEGDLVDFTVKVKARAAEELVSFNTAMFACINEIGLAVIGGNEQYGVSKTKAIEMTERVYPFSVSISPAAASFKEYVAVQLYAESACEVYGEKSVYMHSTCTLANGSTVKGPDALMTKSSNAKYFKYIYPLDFFQVGENGSITAIHVWFSTADGSKSAKCFKKDPAFTITEAN